MKILNRFQCKKKSWKKLKNRPKIKHNKHKHKIKIILIFFNCMSIKKINQKKKKINKMMIQMIVFVDFIII